MGILDVKLITVSVVKQYRKISTNIPDADIEMCIVEAQDLDIRSTLTDKFFYDLLNAHLTSPVDTIFSDIVNGKSYENTAGETVYFRGLAPVIALFAYARLIRNVKDVNLTRFGVVKKTNENSEIADDEAVNKAVGSARETAKAYLQDVLTFLNDQQESYDNWITGSNKSAGTMRITKVNKV